MTTPASVTDAAPPVIAADVAVASAVSQHVQGGKPASVTPPPVVFRSSPILRV